MSAPDTPPARLDVLTWTLHAEPPAAVDAQADRHARWWFVTSELLGWFGIPFFALAVVPSINDVPTLDPYVLIVASALWLVLALGGVLRFRALRRRTGAPVSAELRDLLEATATLRLSPQEHPHSHRTTATDTRHLLRHPVLSMPYLTTVARKMRTHCPPCQAGRAPNLTKCWLRMSRSKWNH